MSPARYGLMAGVGIVLWFVWLIGGLWLGDLVLRTVGWPLGLVVLGVDLAVAVGVPVWWFTRELERS